MFGGNGMELYSWFPGFDDGNIPVEKHDASSQSIFSFSAEVFFIHKVYLIVFTVKKSTQQDCIHV